MGSLLGGMGSEEQARARRGKPISWNLSLILVVVLLGSIAVMRMYSLTVGMSRPTRNLYTFPERGFTRDVRSLSGLAITHLVDPASSMFWRKARPLMSLPNAPSKPVPLEKCEGLSSWDRVGPSSSRLQSIGVLNTLSIAERC